MTAKEARQYRRLEIRCGELQREIRIFNDGRRDLFIDHVELKIAVAEALDAISEGVEIIRAALHKTNGNNEVKNGDI